MDAFSCLTKDVFVKCYGKGQYLLTCCIADYCSGFVQLVCLATFLQVSETDTFDLSQVSIELGFFCLYSMGPAAAGDSLSALLWDEEEDEAKSSGVCTVVELIGSYKQMLFSLGNWQWKLQIDITNWQLMNSFFS